jgi:hypothetical protein
MRARSFILDLLLAGRGWALASATALLMLRLAACAKPQLGIERTPSDIPQSVTYRLEMVDIPGP